MVLSTFQNQGEEKKTVRARILQHTVADGKDVFAGDVVDVSETCFYQLKLHNKAELAAGAAVEELASTDEAASASTDSAAASETPVAIDEKDLELHAEFLRSRGYKVKNGEKAKGFIEHMKEQNRPGYFAEFATWKAAQAAK
jgi:hypothetical protein